MKSTDLQTLRSLHIPVKRWGNSYRVRIKNAKGRNVWVSDLSRGIYQNQLVKQYPEAFGETKTKRKSQRSTKRIPDSEVKERRTRLQKAMQETETKKDKLKTIVKLLRKSTLKNDNDTLKAINSTNSRVETYISRFDRIRKNIISPADKKMLLHFKDSHGNVLKTYHLQDRVININNLFMNEENQYSSGADVELNVLPLTTVEVEWISNPKRSRSERKNFFRYILKTDNIDLSEFQVYSSMELIGSDDSGYDPEKHEDIEAVNYPCFLFSLLKAGVPVKTVQQISQTMFHSSATVDFIKKTAKNFNLYISVKQYYRNETTEKADNNITYYGDKSSKVIKLGSVGQHLFAIKPTKITKAALDHPELIDLIRMI